MFEKIQEAKKWIETKTDVVPKIGLILGSGLGSLGEEIENSIKIDYKDIPHFPISTVEGHEGKLIIGELEGQKVVAMQGRFHYYEGYSMQEVTFPVRVMRALGVEILLVTNAAGGLREDLKPGSLMIIEDHINMMGDNPLIGPNDNRLGVRFPDMSEAYDKELIKLAKNVAKKENIDITTGVYSPISGPSYCTKAELKMLIKIGSDAVGMSTVPEVIVANHGGMKVLGISCITDIANPYIMHPPNHEEIVKVANETKPKFIRLMKSIVKEL
ncbi:purine-nucleoside phosphorylase [Defluviitalea phaphyphila]|uniref:purine-nucleoside phosphorylase n=1 Tax=Defluviitalea phaphyphila TaxID=1473580 RepID=UPI000731880F|nr:purine-nucleoside phosphorylase [Defluviitalea phaphyphila]